MVSETMILSDSPQNGKRSGYFQSLCVVAVLACFYIILPGGLEAVESESFPLPSNSVDSIPQLTLDSGLSTRSDRLALDWWSSKWWLLEKKVKININNFDIVRDSIVDTIIGEHDTLGRRTAYNLASVRNNIHFIFNRLYLLYYPENWTFETDADDYYIDSYTSGMFDLNFYGEQATQIRDFLLDGIQDELDTEAYIDIAAKFISGTGNYSKEEWYNITHGLVTGQWVILGAMSALYYSQNRIDIGTEIPLYKNSWKQRFSALLNFKDYGQAQSPYLEIGTVYDSPIWKLTTLMRHRYGEAEIYKFIRQTFRIQFEADLLSRTYYGKFLKVKWENVFETNIGKRKENPSDDGFEFLHDYSIRISSFQASNNSSRDYGLKVRFLDFHINTLSLSIPALIYEMPSGIYPISKYPCVFRGFFEGGYGTPFTLDSTDDLKRGVHFLVGFSFNFEQLKGWKELKYLRRKEIAEKREG